MADPVWGQLAKAQDNPQTIDEAIAAAVSAHESDSTAHLGSGESLETHRANDVLDHPVGAVLSDKLTTTEELHIFSFESLDSWQVSASGVAITAGNGVSLDNAAYPLSIYIATDLNNDGSGWGTTGLDWLVQWTMYTINDTPSRLTMAAATYSAGAYSGVGFYFDGTNFKAIIKEGSLNWTSSAITVDMTVKHVYRIQYIAANNTIYFSIDGVVVASHDLASFSGYLFETIKWEVWADVTTEPIVWITQLMLSRQAG